MFLLRLAALLQIAFLPGYLLLTALGVRSRGAIEGLIRAFAASLIVNYVLVCSLTAVGLYRPLAVQAILGLELLALLWLHRGKELPRDPLGEWLETLRGGTLAFQLALAAAVATLALFAGYVVLNRDAVISEWDAVVSWNRWALDWAANRFPRTTQHYPQLAPASWSMLYVLTGDTLVQAQVRVLQALYPLAIAAIFLDAGVRKRSARVLLAAPVWALLVHAQASPWNELPGVLSSGWVDIPVSFFALLSVATVLWADERSERTWWLAILFACGAALTKQAGVFALLFVWGWALYTLRDRRFALRSALLIVLLVGSWYVVKQVLIGVGLDDSEVAWVTGGVHGGRGPLERLLYAGVLMGRMKLLGATGVWGLLGALALLVLALWERSLRVVLLGLVVPFLVIWAFLYSYDTRNASLVVPLIALAFTHALPSRDVTWVPGLPLAVAAVAVLAALVGALAYDEDEARRSQTAQQRRIDDAELNAEIYRYFDANPIRGKVFTGYQILGFLPGFRDRMIAKPGFWNLADLEAASGNPEVAYLLEPVNWMNPEVQYVVQERIRLGEYRLLFRAFSKYGMFVMLELRR